MRDELEQLLDDDDDMADLYLSRKLAGPSSPGSGVASWFPGSPTIGSRISRASRASIATIRGDENDVEELEMLLEVISVSYLKPLCFSLWYDFNSSLLQAYFMQIDGTLNKLTTVCEIKSFRLSYHFWLQILSELTT